MISGKCTGAHDDAMMPTGPTAPTCGLVLFMDDELIINYHDAVIYGSDLKHIETRTDWLNDSCIHFFFAHLQQQQQQQQQQQAQQHSQSQSLPITALESSSLSTRNNPSPSLLCTTTVVFMDPSVISFWMHQCIDQDEIDDFVANIEFPGLNRKTNKYDNDNSNNDDDYGLIFIAVNDKMSSNNNGTVMWDVSNNGTHWSLLMIEVITTKNARNHTKKKKNHFLQFWHIDSIRNSGNIRAAQDIATKIRLHVYPEASIITKRNNSNDNNITINNNTSSSLSLSLSTTMVVVHQVESPQQQNFYDCGVHVLGAAKILSMFIIEKRRRCGESNNHNTTTRSTSTSILGMVATEEEELVECLRQEIIGGGMSSQQLQQTPHNFCTKLRDEIATEIRRLHKDAIFTVGNK